MADEMTSKERVLAALKWEEIDRIPVFSGKSSVASKLLNVKFNKEFLTDGETIARAELAAWDAIKDDSVGVYANLALLEALGADSVWPDNDYPMFRKPVIASHEDADRLEVPDPKTNKYMLEIQKAVRILKKKAGDEVIVSATLHGIFNLSARLLGTETLLTSLSRDPVLVHKVFEKILEAQIKYGEALAEAGVDLLHIGDATSSPACISPKTYEKFALPYHTKVLQAFKRAGAIASYHPCGGEYPIIDQIGRTGADLLHFSELVDLTVAQKIFVGRIAVGGTVDPSKVLFLGTPQGVEEHVKGIIERLPFKTGTILAPGCGISPNFPVDNIKALVDAARKHGKYN